MKWKNVPIPETILIPLLLGILLEVLFPQPIVAPNLALALLGGVSLLAGLLLILWSVRAAGRQDITSPDELIRTGPYTISRNPMYLAWIGIYLSGIFITRSLWIVLLLPMALAATHFWAVLPEEKGLQEKFGDSFRDYCEKVRRYL